MEVISSIDALRERLADWRHEGDHIALVPTLGNLHDGHLSLVEIAREHAERVVVSIFVDPLQFSKQEDFDNFPRALERDKRWLKRVNADLIFLPEVETIYPFGTDSATSVTVPALTDDVHASQMLGQFDDATNIIMRLFSLMQPDAAVFGQKDYQQQLAVARMVLDLNMPINVICGPTQREDDGLAISSRNRLLATSEREIAPALFETLDEIGRGLETGQRNFDDLEAQGLAKLKDLGFRPDYVSIRRAENLEIPDRDCDELVVLGAAWLGDVHLIDNLVVHI